MRGRRPLDEAPSRARLGGLTVVALVVLGARWWATAETPPRVDPPWPRVEAPPAITPSTPHPAPVVLGRSLAIYPAQRLALRFSHAEHVGRLGMGCGDCHAGAATSARASDPLAPTMARCLDCHVVGAAPVGAGQVAADCVTCHPAYELAAPRFPAGAPAAGVARARSVLNPPPGVELPTARLRFSHRAHVSAGATCADCHAGVEAAALATRAHLPTMARCLGCHTGQAGEPPDACVTCHLSGADGRLVTALDTGWLIPVGRLRDDDHRLDFARDHGAAAQTDEAYCASCHAEAFCVDCHNGVIKPAVIHPPNYAQLHAIEAISAPEGCGGCHNLQSFCLGCHELTRVSERRAPRVALEQHPPGFIDQVDSPVFHGPLARANLTACVSCHQESTCVRCHAGINPHGPDFAGRCAELRRRNEAACVKCHLPTGAELARLRALCP